ncbi:MAG: cadherin-like domain-containing protein, partial [Gammaproteobacteria bacterium]|nr:cadherin-like domain-containing protein [Gammaproteobacteria bacterium]
MATDEDTISSNIILSGTTTSSDALSVEIVTNPSNGSLVYSGTTAPLEVTYVPTGDYNGSDSFQFRVSDGNGGQSELETVNISVSAVNDAPAFTVVTNQNTTLGDAFSVVVSATDVDSSALTYSSTGTALPSWATLNTATGEISGTSDTVATTSGVEISANDGDITVASNTFDLAVAIAWIDGAPDISFGSNGVAVFDNAGEDEGNDIIVDGSGNIYVGGVRATHNLSIWRLLDNGSIDTTFAGGIVSAGGNNNLSAGGIALDINGNIAITGNFNSDWYMRAYDSTGTQVAQDGYNGISGMNDAGRSMITDSLGNIYSLGVETDFPNWRLAVRKYTTSFTLDATWGTGGHSNLGVDRTPTGVAIDTQDRILITEDNYGRLARVNAADGSLDQFVAGGVTAASGVVADSSDYIYTVGGYSDLEIARFDSNMALDATWGTGGVLTIDTGFTTERPEDVIIDNTSGNLVITGYIADAGNNDAIVWVVDTTGSGALDTSFGGTGYVRMDNSTNDQARQVVNDTNGRYVVTGFTNGSGKDM